MGENGNRPELQITVHVVAFSSHVISRAMKIFSHAQQFIFL